MKKTLLLLMALVMSAGFAFSQTTLAPSSKVPGVYIAKGGTSPDGYSGANIILGYDSINWPFSKGGADGVAFVPTKSATYHLTFSATSNGVSGFRVRWLHDNSGGNYTAGDVAVVNTAPYNVAIPADQTATLIPAYFQGTMSNGDTKTFNVDFTMDSTQTANQLIGNLCIR